MTKRTIFLRAVACFFACAAFFHLSRVIAPQPDDSAGGGRHTVFVAINLFSAICMWRRPRWFKYPFAVLVMQQIYSHGGLAWRTWVEQGELDLTSLLIVVLLPLTWVVLLTDT